jgi:hypothetical protein
MSQPSQSNSPPLNPPQGPAQGPATGQPPGRPTDQPRVRRSLEERWRLRASTLRSPQWQTDTWHDLVESLQLRDQGDLPAIREWYRETLSSFEGLAAHCQRQDIPAVPTCESQVAQSFLRDGAAAWLEALRMLATNQPAEVVLQRAEHGQRLLVSVQLLEARLLSQPDQA